MKKIYEFLLWNNCNNNCSFCHQRMHERKIDDKILNPEEQIDSLNKCKEFLDTQFEKGNHILLVGGEIFDITNSEVKKAFIELILKKILKMMSNNEIELLYINTNLLYEDIILLDWFLSLFQANNLLNRLKFTTSYDIIGRFNIVGKELLFYKNLKYITDTYKDIHVVVNTVLTNIACKRIQDDMFGADEMIKYLSNQGKTKWTIKDWIDYFKVEINTIPYIRLGFELAPEMPTKSTVFKTLQHIDNIIPGYLEQYINNIGLKQEKLLYEYRKNIKDFVYCSSKLGECGHSINFKQSFKDSDKCFPCEIKKLLENKDLLKE